MPKMTPEARLAFDWTLYSALAIFLTVRTVLLRRRTGSLFSPGYSDVFLLSSFACGLVNVCLSAWVSGSLIANRGNPRNVPVTELPPELLVPMNKIFYVQRLLYVTIVWGVKAAFLAIYVRGKEHFTRWILWLWRGIAAVVTGTYVLNIVITAAWCHPIQSHWYEAAANRCSPWRSIANVTVGAVTNIITDVLLITFPLLLIRSLNLSRSTFIAGTFILILGFFTVAMAVVRYVLLIFQIREGPESKGQPTWYQMMSVAEMEGFGCIIAGALPAMRVLWGQSREKRERREAEVKSWVRKRESGSAGGWGRREPNPVLTTTTEKERLDGESC